jgi:hypothetical protein
MIVPSLIFISSLVVSGLSTPVGNPVIQVENDLSTIDAKTSIVNEDFSKFPDTGGSLEEILVSMALSLDMFLCPHRLSKSAWIVRP